MSYILDALRKSEQDRQRGKVPDFHSNPSPVSSESGKRLNIWAVIAIAVVLINLTLVAVFWNRLMPDSAEQPTAVAERPASDSVPEPVQQQPAEPASIPAPAIPPSVVAEDSSATEASVGQPVSPAQQQNEPQFETIRPAQSSTGESEDTVETGSVPQMAYVPQIEELSSIDRQNIPDMTFSSHMFSSVSKYRSVIINGKRLKEGQRYNNDIVVREITESGVVMSQGGLLFQVDVLGRWAQ
ncbi:general secretion pathway protein GspB [Ketobacter sp.]|nr:MAG: hypothetical protein D6160_00650 [Ketobacter sp.]